MNLFCILLHCTEVQKPARNARIQQLQENNSLFIDEYIYFTMGLFLALYVGVVTGNS